MNTLFVVFDIILGILLVVQLILVLIKYKKRNKEHKLKYNEMESE